MVKLTIFMVHLPQSDFLKIQFLENKQINLKYIKSIYTHTVYTVYRL